MKWRLVGLVAKDGTQVDMDYEVILRGAIGKAAVVSLPHSLFEGHNTSFIEVVERVRAIARETTGLEDVLAVEEGVEFFRLVPADLDERISEALGECESCCLDDETDRKRVAAVLRAKLTG